MLYGNNCFHVLLDAYRKTSRHIFFQWRGGYHSRNELFGVCEIIFCLFWGPSCLLVSIGWDRGLELSRRQTAFIKSPFIGYVDMSNYVTCVFVIYQRQFTIFWVGTLVQYFPRYWRELRHQQDMFCYKPSGCSIFIRICIDAYTATDRTEFKKHRIVWALTNRRDWLCRVVSYKDAFLPV